MIKSLSVKGLNNRIDADLEFNEDLNIITGKNGSGKTTLLKLLWYLISGNLERIVPEIPFQSVFIETDSFYLSIAKEKSDEIIVISKISGKKESVDRGDSEDIDIILDELSRPIARVTKKSIFFPTFRRIEGGFYEENLFFRSETGMSQLKAAMSKLSDELSVDDHKFITSISTNDIDEILREKHSNISLKTNDLHVRLSKEITQKISETKGQDDASLVLNDIQDLIEEVSRERTELLRPFSSLTGRISDILQYKSFDISSKITFGETKEAFSSDKLSSGEKQMLSFLCYNAFSENTPIFIDEPELSLHVDWQRLLLPTLLEQGTENQFFIATHSPFIYAKYPEKEILLGDDRGAT